MSPEAKARLLEIIRADIEQRYGVKVVPCDDDDPDAIRMRSQLDHGEPLGDVGEARARQGRRDLDAD